MKSTNLLLIAWTVVVIIISALIATVTPAVDKEAKDTCEYDMDLTSNSIKITCQGSPSKVNIYADTAHVTGDDADDVMKSYTHDQNRKTKNSKTPGVATGIKKEIPTSGRHGNGKSRDRKFPSNISPKAENPGSPDPRSGKKPGMTSSALQKDHWLAWELPEPDNGFSTVVWNATQKLDDAKKKLSSYANFIRNISSQLENGDVSLRADMENLRRTSNSATILKEGIVAAMRNQFNFMRSALLTRNNEVERLVTTLKVLVDVTSHGLQGALSAHKAAMEQVSHVNATMAAVRRMISHELRKRRRRNKGDKSGKKQKACPKEISAFGAGRSRSVKDIQVGSYMVESLNPSDLGSVWIMQGSEPNDQLLEFDIDNDIDYGLVGRYISLPFFCVGTGHAVFRRHFYCHVASSNRIVKYHLKRMDIVAQLELPGASNSNRYPYQSGQNTDVDLAVDEYGLWAIYATDASHGNVVVSKINHQDMEVDRTWVTNYPKRRLGNAFLICGVLYATDSSSDAPTFVRYSYDTETQRDRLWEPGQLPFANSATPTNTNDVTSGSLSSSSNSEAAKSGTAAATATTHQRHWQDVVNCVMLSYDFRTSTIISWNEAKVEKFKVYFKDTEP